MSPEPNGNAASNETGADWQDGQLKVVVNLEAQYSIWPVDYELPAGWHDAGMRGDKSLCLEFITGVWRDERPLSMRDEAPDSTASRAELAPQGAGKLSRARATLSANG
jgi:MbtH protein